MRTQWTTALRLRLEPMRRRRQPNSAPEVCGRQGLLDFMCMMAPESESKRIDDVRADFRCHVEQLQLPRCCGLHANATAIQAEVCQGAPAQCGGAGVWEVRGTAADITTVRG